jgi:hypothetical protein
MRQLRTQPVVFTMCLAVAMVFFLPLAGTAEDSGKRVINYLPKDFAINSAVARGLHVQLQDSDFAGSEILAKRKACRKCNELRLRCPEDTCLEYDSAGAPHKKCYSFDCNPKQIPFRPGECSPIDVNDNCNPACSGGQFNCYEDGCPAFQPEGDCKVDASDSAIWYCDRRGYAPRRFCTPNNPDISSCSRSIEFYDDSQQADRAKCNNSPNFCYKYVPTADFKSCAARCSSDVKGWEKCVRDYNCCREPLFTGNNPPCKESACDTLVSANSPCRTAPSPEECKRVEEAYTQWLLGLTDKDYLPIDDVDGFPSGKSMKFKFSARENEAIGAIWSINVETITPINTYAEDNTSIDPPQFFSMVRIIDPSGQTKAYSSHHQRSFRGNCSIEAAAYFDEKPENGGLEPFKTYTVELCYFIPMFDDDQKKAELSVWLKGVELKIYRAQRHDVTPSGKE